MTNSSLSGILQDSIGREQCRQIILVSRIGTMVARAGKESAPVAQSLGRMVASAFANGGELGRLLGGGEQNFQLQRGRRQDLLLCPMPSGMILAATFPVQVDEDHALALADHITQQIEALTPALTPALGAHSPLAPELRDEAFHFFDQIFSSAA